MGQKKGARNAPFLQHGLVIDDPKNHSPPLFPRTPLESLKKRSIQTGNRFKGGAGDSQSRAHAEKAGRFGRLYFVTLPLEKTYTDYSLHSALPSSPHSQTFMWKTVFLFQAPRPRTRKKSAWPMLCSRSRTSCRHGLLAPRLVRLRTMRRRNGACNTSSRSSARYDFYEIFKPTFVKKEKQHADVVFTIATHTNATFVHNYMKCNYPFPIISSSATGLTGKRISGGRRG